MIELGGPGQFGHSSSHSPCTCRRRCAAYWPDSRPRLAHRRRPLRPCPLPGAPTPASGRAILVDGSERTARAPLRARRRRPRSPHRRSNRRRTDASCVEPPSSTRQLGDGGGIFPPPSATIDPTMPVRAAVLALLRPCSPPPPAFELEPAPDAAIVGLARSRSTRRRHSTPQPPEQPATSNEAMHNEGVRDHGFFRSSSAAFLCAAIGAEVVRPTTAQWEVPDPRRRAGTRSDRKLRVLASKRIGPQRRTSCARSFWMANTELMWAMARAARPLRPKSTSPSQYRRLNSRKQANSAAKNTANRRPCASPPAHSAWLSLLIRDASAKRRRVRP